jgi:diguanylate cyclase
MNGSYHAWIVILSIVVAIAPSHAALSLAQRMSRSTGMQARLWLADGAVSMGIGITAMHYVGMLAIAVTPGLDYDPLLFAASVVPGAAAACRSRRNGWHC